MENTNKTEGKTSGVSTNLATEQVKKIINTVQGEAKFVRTDIEDKNEKWDGINLSTRDGFYIIHEGDRHHIYKVITEVTETQRQDGHGNQVEYMNWKQFSNFTGNKSMWVKGDQIQVKNIDGSVISTTILIEDGEAN